MSVFCEVAVIRFQSEFVLIAWAASRASAKSAFSVR